MTTLQEQLHAEHLERQRKWFPPLSPAQEPPPMPEPSSLPPPDPVIELALHQLTKRVERLEQQLFDRDPEVEFQNQLTCRQIRKIVADFYQIQPQALVSQRRYQQYTWPRQIAMYLATRLTTRSLPYIGRSFGGRDHTTVLHAKRKVERLCESNERVRDELRLIIMRICELTGWKEEGA